jgi:hypothetical protein
LTATPKSSNLFLDEETAFIDKQISLRTMPFTLYDIAVPQALRAMSAMKFILEKAETHIRENKLQEEEFMQLNLWPDMKPICFQAYAAISLAQGIAEEFANITSIKLTGYPTTLEELQTLVKAAASALENVDKNKFDEVEHKQITVRSPSGKREKWYSGYEALMYYGLPNMHFHMAMVYAILRLQGVPVGKQDYVAPPQ